MKRTTIKIAAVLLIAVMCLGIFVACGPSVSGTYSGTTDIAGLAGATVTYTFSGKKVTVESTATILGFEKTETYEGTFELVEAEDGLKITFTFGEEGDSFSGTYSFSQGEENGVKYVKIGGAKYNKQ